MILPTPQCLALGPESKAPHIRTNDYEVNAPTIGLDSQPDVPDNSVSSREQTIDTYGYEHRFEQA
jgi:hypothetical protein